MKYWYVLYPDYLTGVMSLSLKNLNFGRTVKLILSQWLHFYQFEGVMTVFWCKLFHKDIFAAFEFACVWVCVHDFLTVFRHSWTKATLPRCYQSLPSGRRRRGGEGGCQQPQAPGHLSSHRFSYSQMSAITAPHSLTHKSTSLCLCTHNSIPSLLCALRCVSVGVCLQFLFVYIACVCPCGCVCKGR